jgi:hypothetical protein
MKNWISLLFNAFRINLGLDDVCSYFIFPWRLIFLLISSDCTLWGIMNEVSLILIKMGGVSTQTTMDTLDYCRIQVKHVSSSCSQNRLQKPSRNLYFKSKWWKS